MDAALTGLTTRRYTLVQRENFISPLCAECNRRMIPNWVEDRGRWIINGFRYPGVRCSTHERRVLPEYFGLPQHVPAPNARRDTATSARSSKAGSRFLGLGAKRAQRST